MFSSLAAGKDLVITQQRTLILQIQDLESADLQEKVRTWSSSGKGGAFIAHMFKHNKQADKATVTKLTIPYVVKELIFTLKATF